MPRVVNQYQAIEMPHCTEQCIADDSRHVTTSATASTVTQSNVIDIRG